MRAGEGIVARNYILRSESPLRIERQSVAQRMPWGKWPHLRVHAKRSVRIQSNPTKSFAMPKTQTLNDLLVEELKDLYSAENQLIKALPKMAKAASNEELKAGFEEHLEQTKNHVSRLERVFELLGASPKGKKCQAMEGLIAEASEKLELEADSAAKDAALIGAAQKVEHYEIAGYGTVRTWAEVVGEDEVAKLLEETLDEESETDERLTELAETINEEAEQPNE